MGTTYVTGSLLVWTTRITGSTLVMSVRSAAHMVYPSTLDVISWICGIDNDNIVPN